MEVPKISGLTRDQVLTLMNSRSYQQYRDGIEAFESGKCIFCDPLGPKNVVLHTTKIGNIVWRIWRNPYPIKHTSAHLIMAPVRHIINSKKITGTDWCAQGKLWIYARDVLGISAGASVGRFGSPEFNSGSILHLHSNIIVPDGTGDVQVTIGKSPDKIKTITARMKVFEKLRAGTRIEDLLPDERTLVEGRL